MGSARIADSWSRYDAPHAGPPPQTSGREGRQCLFQRPPRHLPRGGLGVPNPSRGAVKVSTDGPPIPF
ncbi:hypothetical protein FHU13_003384 [Methylobacterium sp. R2-1]|nr:hypothetical protein [Methylobacterium sp. R2-1]